MSSSDTAEGAVATAVMATPAVAKAETSPPATLPVRMDFLDGLRGVSALYVVFHHAYLVYLCEKTQVATPAPRGNWVFEGGKIAVAVFIVLSGFCLMMPVARSKTEQLSGGFGRYIKRRALRILPAYYAAILVIVSLIALVPALQRDDGNHWHLALPADAGAVFSHVFMLQGLRTEWVHKIDPPMWTVATEWWIYFFFPMLLLPVWRKFGPFAAAVVGVAVGSAPHLLFKGTPYALTWSSPWYLGLFAMGMLGAVACVGRRRTKALDALRDHAGKVTLFMVVVLAGLIWRTNWWGNKILPVDLLLGVLATAFIVYCANRPQTSVRKMLECKPAIWLGIISYSLYLIHEPVLVLSHRWTEAWHTSAELVFGLTLGVGVPASVAVAVAFFYVFERPFLEARAKMGSAATQAITHAKTT